MCIIEVSIYGSFFRILHCSTFGQSKHSSGKGALGGSVCSRLENCAHFAGDSNTLGYSAGLMSTIFIFSIVMSSFDMQCGHA